ncbi:MAG: hypothetical protein ACRDDP_08365 [Plesiomonas sp.]|uniref:hypothetical protein n=1 Tax=Plesiomonas sp. TaxID=2486279 RepID=UPI003EE51761
MYPRIFFLISVLSALLTSSVFAVQMQPLNELIDNHNILNIDIKNDERQEIIYTLSLNETTFPDGHETLKAAHPTPFYVSPAQLRLAAGQKGHFTLHYNLKRDNQERYYRASLRQLGVAAIQLGQVPAAVVTRYPVEIKSVVVVRPITPVMKYTLKNNRLTNNSNGYVLVMQDTHCGQQQGSTHFLPANASMQISSQDKQQVITMGMVNKLTTVLDSCKKSG